MTPQERQLVDDLFDRLSKVENAPRDRDAADAISQGQRRAPNAMYALVQTVLLQDEALKRAHMRLQELEGAEEPQRQQPGFLDSMRDAIFGPGPSQGSVPNVPPPQQGNRPVWNSGQAMSQAQPQGQYAPAPYGASPSFGQGSPAIGGGGSFLGTAAAAAAGMVGGSLLLGSIRSMMGGPHQSFADSAYAGDNRGSWSGDQSNNDLARDAGINDIGSSGHRDDNSRSGFFDQASNDQNNDDMDGDNYDSGDGGDSDYA